MSTKPLFKPLEIKISTVVAIVAILHESEPAVIQAALHELTGGELDYFENELVVLDMGALADPTQLDLAAVIPLFRVWGLHPAAVRNAPEALYPAIVALGLAIDVAAKARPEAATVTVAAPEAVVSAPAPTVSAPAAASSAMIIDTPVRAGQRIYARGCDLIVLASVNHGAEVIADGSIHVYAALRGRALAGASGNLEARIFATNMEPELVSIAGIYRTFDEGFPKDLAQQPIQIKLAGGRLDLLPLQGK